MTPNRTSQELQLYLETLLSVSIAEAKLIRIRELIKNTHPATHVILIDDVAKILRIESPKERTRMTKDEIRAAKKFLAQGRPTSPGCVAFMLRSCASDMSAYGGFVWPRSGEVSCPDWKPARECGNGLHGLLWGEGSVSLTAQDDPNANWLVCAVWTTDVVDLGDKVKVPRSFVVFTGSRFDAVAELQKLGARKSHWGIYSAGRPRHRDCG
jgi:hypothetical protein